jgi:hypothetical protein
MLFYVGVGVGVGVDVVIPYPFIIFPDFMLASSNGFDPTVQPV